jgi:hypothetical protein
MFPSRWHWHPGRAFLQMGVPGPTSLCVGICRSQPQHTSPIQHLWVSTRSAFVSWTAYSPQPSSDITTSSRAASEPPGALNANTRSYLIESRSRNGVEIQAVAIATHQKQVNGLSSALPCPRRIMVPVDGRMVQSYILKYSTVLLSRAMGVPPGTAKVRKFVAAPSLLIRYNSRIPLVVYVPRDGEVRYRIWEASKTTNKAKIR